MKIKIYWRANEFDAKGWTTQSIAEPSYDWLEGDKEAILLETIEVDGPTMDQQKVCAAARMSNMAESLPECNIETVERIKQHMALLMGAFFDDPS